MDFWIRRQAERFLEIVKSVFARLEPEPRINPSPQATHAKFTFRFRDVDKPGRPRVPHLLVHVSRQIASYAQNADLFRGRTNEQGEILFQVPATQAAVSVLVQGLDGVTLLSKTFNLNQNAPVVTTELNLADYHASLAVSLKSWEQTLKREISRRLAEIFKQEDVLSLADVRLHAKKLRAIKDLTPGQRAELEELVAHANLQLLSRSLHFNQFLIDARFKDIFGIAKLSRDSFLKATVGIDELITSQIHDIAQRLVESLKNRALLPPLAQTNGQDYDGTKAETNRPCGCDCQSAVSPLAYLADLLDLVIREVNHDGNLLDLSRLESLFYQPFGSMPADCTAAEENVRQIRICIEVLRRRAQVEIKPEELNENRHTTEHPARALDALLAGLGTSTRELRLLLGASEADRIAQAQALGIAESQLNSLLLRGAGLSEHSLEKIFGFQDTTRDPRSFGVKLSDSQNAILRWQLKGVEWRRNTTDNGTISGNLTRTSDKFFLDLFLDQPGGQRVAHANQSALSEDEHVLLTLVPEGNSGLYGNILINKAAVSADFVLLPIPKLLSWQWRELFKVWQNEDHPQSPYDPQLPDDQRLPMVDPDSLTEAHFCRPVNKNDAYTFWTDRAGQVTTERAAIDLIDARKRTIQEMFDWVWKAAQMPAWQDIETDLNSGDETKVDDRLEQLRTLHLSAATFAFLNDLRKRALAAEAEPAPAVTDPEIAAREEAEREQALDILLNAKKRREFYPGWRADELAAGKAIQVSPKFFCIPSVELPTTNSVRFVPEQMAVWQSELERNSQPPIVDPDVLNPTRSIAAIDGDADSLRQRRDDDLDAIRAALESSLPFDQRITLEWLDARLVAGDIPNNGRPVIVHALGLEPINNLQTAFNERRLQIQPQQYGLKHRELDSLLTMRRLLIADPNLVDTRDQQNVLHILLAAEKRRYYFPAWRTEEADLKLTLSPQFFRNPDHPLLQLVTDTREPELIEWRGDLGRLREWRSKLAARYRQQASVQDGLRLVVDKAEEASLPALRDGLIDALYKNPSGSERERNKNDTTNRLLINASESACRKTTRVAQAIETLQLLVWGVLNRQIEDSNFKIPNRNEEAFDANWYWLKSYATWRSAMFVYLYPENILLPRLRPETEQTPLFKAIIRILDGSASPSAPANDSSEPAAQDEPQSDEEIEIQRLVDVLYEGLNGASAKSKAGTINLGQSARRVDANDGVIEDRVLIYLKDNAAEIEDKLYLPLHFALTLQQDRQYEAAIYWFADVYSFRNNDLQSRVVEVISGLSPTTAPDYNGENWLNDQLNPHLLAATRPDVILRFVQISVVRLLLEYAEVEFSIDTSESVARARELYSTAQDILDGDELKQDLTDCEGEVKKLIMEIGEIDEEVTQVVTDGLIDTPEPPEELTEELIEALRNLRAGLGVGGPRPTRDDITTLIRKHLTDPTVVSVGDRMKAVDANLHRALSTQLVEPDVFDQTQQISAGSDGDSRPQPRARMARTTVPLPGTDLADNEEPVTEFVRVKMPDVVFEFCIPPNAILIGLQLRTKTGLFKVSNCMNLAGMRRELPVYAAATDTRTGMPGVGASGTLSLPGTSRLQGTQYRYRVLVERAKQLINIAQQLEATYLSFLEKFDLETYNILRARHDLDLAGANLALQALRVTEAKTGKELAFQQAGKAAAAVTHYEGLIERELLPSEKDALLYTNIAVAVNVGVAATKGVMIIGPALGAAGGVGAVAAAVASALVDPTIQSAILGALSSASSASSMVASFARRAEEWEFQKELAKLEKDIAEVQKTLAADRLNIVNQEQSIATIGEDNARDVLNFLNNKFTNADLYSWMSGIVGGIYRYFLEQSTVLAKLAQAQLAFERQETGLNFILSDYSTVTSGSGFLDTRPEAGTDRRGMTGSARLLHDLYRLDQHAFTTDRRKLQLSKTLSLALRDPIAFQQFRETGVLPFTTSLDLFDRDFPGNYLRLIKRMRTSVIALIPPTLGIKGTLASTGISEVVVSTESGGNFEIRNITREPELVALTAPNNDSGMFELQEQPEMLLPFEGLGVANSWEFRMPKAANAFDFSTIADVLITMEYTAFDSSTYRELVTQRLGRTLIADRPFSFRHQFADVWYDLHHPELLPDGAQQMVVSFTTRREDFPPNVSELKIEHISLFIAYKAGSTDRVNDLSLRFTSQGQTGAADYAASPNDNGIVSTRLGNAASWRPLMTQVPVGEWSLTLPLSDPATVKVLKEDQIEDILFVITYGGLTPEWPAS